MASGQGHGSMSLSMKLIRLVLMVFNLIFIIIGSILLGLGIYIVKDPQMQKLRPLLNPDITSKISPSLTNIEILAIILVVIGGILLFIGFLGCCGSLKSFRCLHIFYSIIVGGIILLEIAIIVICIVYQNRLKTELVPKLQRSIIKYYVGPPFHNSTSINSMSLAWDFAQFNLHCCGAINKYDYLNATNWDRTNPYQPNTTLLVPFTCCPLNTDKNWNGLPTNMSEANTCATTGLNAYSQGCYDRLMDLLSKYKLYIIIAIVIVLVVELFAVLFAVLLYRRKKEYDPL